jgi:cyclohexanone monooxygenase
MSNEMPERVDALVVGAGFGGMYMLHRLRGLGIPAHVIEAGEGVGGTWYWNRYPGARCDVESMQYSYSFDDALQREWRWSERFAAQPEILDYANHVADRLDLRRDISLGTRLAAARFDEATSRWTAEMADGRRVICRYLILATGCLSSAKLPEIEGIGTSANGRTRRWTSRASASASSAPAPRPSRRSR